MSSERAWGGIVRYKREVEAIKLREEFRRYYEQLMTYQNNMSAPAASVTITTPSDSSEQEAPAPRRATPHVPTLGERLAQQQQARTGSVREHISQALGRLLHS